ncbi:MAG: alpha/beta hydrolase [Magnetococcus sp. DMHC-6]
MEQIFQSILHIAAGVAIAIVLILYPFLYFYQEKLLFFPKPIDPEMRHIINHHLPQGEVHLQTPDGITLHGWLARTADRENRSLMIYFGGNAEEISAFMLEAMQIVNWSILAFNYRGFGDSGGHPGEKELFADARSIYDWAVANETIHAQPVVVMGRSLGSGVAVHLASERPLHGVILITPYDSIRAVAQGIYPYAPVDWLLKHPFDSLKVAPSLTPPLLSLVAPGDNIIPNKHSQRLLEAWGGPKTEKIFPNTDHNTIASDPNYWPTIQNFLTTLS